MTASFDHFCAIHNTILKAKATEARMGVEPQSDLQVTPVIALRKAYDTAILDRLREATAAC